MRAQNLNVFTVEDIEDYDFKALSDTEYRSAHHCTSMLKERRRDYGLRETRGTVSPLDRCPKTKTDYWLILYLPDLWYSPNCTTRWIPFPPSDN